MKKIFTLIVALMATTISIMAQKPASTMDFLGTCKWVESPTGFADRTAEINGTVKMTVDYTNNTCDVTIPAMTLKGISSGETKQRSTTFLSVPFDMEGTTIKWSITTAKELKAYFDNDPTDTSTETVTNLSGTYTIGGSLSFDMTWHIKQVESVVEHFTITDGKYVSTAIADVAADGETAHPAAMKAIVGGKLVITKDGKQFNAAGAQMPTK